jgi:hypothetical protein
MREKNKRRGNSKNKRIIERRQKSKEELGSRNTGCNKNNYRN